MPPHVKTIRGESPMNPFFYKEEAGQRGDGKYSGASLF